MAGPFDLSGPQLAPAAGGRARELVILLHGYGADGQDLIGLAPHMRRALPHAAFVAPNAPFPCEAGGYGYQWFSFADRDPAMLLGGVRAAAAILQGFIAGELGERGLGDDRLALVGFSQGAMMALHVAPRRVRAAAAIVGYSGALVGPDRLASEMLSRPPILLVHGDADPVVPFAELAAAAAALDSAGLTVTAVARPGLAHGIDETGLTLGARFLADAFAP